jgi:hypothetical protein
LRLPKRKVTTFSLSFLDIMACGFGAVTLLFLILKHDATAVESADPYLVAETNLLAEEVQIGEEELVTLKNSLANLEKTFVDAQGLSKRVLSKTQEIRRELSAQSDPEQDVELLRKQVEVLKEETAKLQEQGNDDNVRRFVGEGERQYLTGLKLGGQRVMILVDTSASMLSDSIINVIRKRNMSDAVKRNADKWKRAVRTTEWLVAQLPRTSSYQIYTFNTKANAVNGDNGVWRDTADSAGMDQSIKALARIAPKGGTSLINAFQAIGDFSNPPDNLFLITDGLPTQGKKAPSGSTISGKERAKLFNEASGTLPRGIPLNVLLFPMEGDPVAAASFWQLALFTRGSFMSPSKDWP